MKAHESLRPGRASRIAAVIGAGIALPLLAAAPAQAAGGLSLVPEMPVLVALIVAFVVLVFPLNSVIFKPLLKVVDERSARIEGARRRAGKLEEDAEAAIAKYRAQIREAREEAEGARRTQLDSARSEQGSITGEARGEAEQEIVRARAEIVASLDEARASLRTASEDLARVAAERILGRTLS